MAKRYCCPECFDDHGLRDNIIPSRTSKRGTCSFCRTDDTLLIEPAQLAPEFGSLVNVYEASDTGKSLVEWMKDDWALFSHPRMDIAHAKELLAEILDDGEVVRKLFIPSPSYNSKALAQWKTLRGQLLHVNRWFFDDAIDRDRLKLLLPHLAVSTTKLPPQWFRARTRIGDANFTIDEMNAPPRRRASHGRANPAGIPYLYLGSTPETAAAEIRPHTGEVVCVADFTIPELHVLDLRDPRKRVSPLALGDVSGNGQLRADLPFLERLGDELTRPVLPTAAAIDYIPTQYLCEFIKTSGYDGVLYKSSVSNGFNVALFDPAKAVGGTVSEYNVTRVSVEVAPP